jgi:hypothetical protein
VYNQQYEDVLALVNDDAELARYACQFVVNKRGGQNLVARLFVHRAGHANTEEFAYIDTTGMDTATFPNKDDLEPLASCLSIAELGGECVFVGTPEALAECVAHLRKAPVVGFDCEWKAATAHGQDAEACAVLQLASSTRAFVIDTIALKLQCAPLGEIFRSASIVKLGFDTKGDVTVLAKVLPANETATSDGGSLVQNLLDVQALAKRLNNVTRSALAGTDAASLGDGDELEDGEVVEDGEVSTDPPRPDTGDQDTPRHPSGQVNIVPPETVDDSSGAVDHETQPPSSAAAGEDASVTKKKRKFKGKNKHKWKGPRAARGAGDDGDRDSRGLSLAAVAEQYLGKPLDKRSRMSDWERRPLTRAQLHYAAMDALVLVAIFEAMRGRFSEADFSKAVHAQQSRHRGAASASEPKPKPSDACAAPAVA